MSSDRQSLIPHDIPPVVKEIMESMPRLALKLNEPMSRHCSFRIGGPAQVLALPSGALELEELLALSRRMGEKPLIIGNGTNLLITDEPLRRIVIKLCDGLGQIRRLNETRVFAEAGVTLSRLAGTLLSMGLGGFEFAQGIPGSVGGALVMNAGAYGGEMKDVTESTVCFDENLIKKELDGGQQGFSYRSSVFSGTGMVVLGGVFRLTPDSPESIRQRISILSEKRRSSQPLDKPSAGSAFKRPKNAYAAALIDQAGLRGFRCGGAQVSEKHAGFIINAAGASFEDVYRLIEHIRETVMARFGVELEPEIKIITNNAG